MSQELWTAFDLVVRAGLLVLLGCFGTMVAAYAWQGVKRFHASGMERLRRYEEAATPSPAVDYAPVYQLRRSVR